MLNASPRAAGRFCRGTLALLLLAGSLTPLLSQDQIVLESGDRKSGTIIGVQDETVLFQSGPVKTTIKLSQIQSVTKPAPEAYNQTIELWSKGDAAGALRELRPLVENFRGLPVQWAERASALLGEIQLSEGQIDEAEKTLEAFQESYPDAQALAATSLARVALEKGDVAKARELVKPVVEESQQALFVEPAKAASFAQAHYVSGRAFEQEGNHAEALKHYVTAYAVFHHDPAVATLAAERAKKLEADKSVVVP